MNYSICVSGAADGKTVDADKHLAERLGKEIARLGHTLTTGATVGLPFYAAKAAKKQGGMSIGFSPAASLREHVFKYRLPIGVFDFVNYTGLNYVGRDAYLVLSSDAVITIGGRFGSLHEFTTALESNTICGVLTDSGGTADIIPELMNRLEAVHRQNVFFDDNPERLIQKVIKRLDKDYEGIDTKAIAQSWFLNDSMSENRASHSG